MHYFLFIMKEFLLFFVYFLFSGFQAESNTFREYCSSIRDVAQTVPKEGSELNDQAN